MVSHLLVPLDGSALAQSVLPHAQALASALGADVTLLSVVERNERNERLELSDIDPISWQLRKVEVQMYLNSLRQQWQDEAAPVESVLLEGTAAERIQEYADEHHIDLIVLSSHGQSGLTKWNLSSITQKIVYQAYKSFMLVRAYKVGANGTAAAKYRRMVVPLDGSMRAEHVLPIATRLAQAHEAQLLLVHVVARPAVFEQQPLTVEDNQLVERLMSRNRTEAGRYLEQLQTRLDCQSEIHLLNGRNDSDTLLDFVGEAEADLVILSAHGASGERARPYGSVVTSFIAYSSAHLLVIQDLLPGEIRPTQAEVVARSDSGYNGLSRIFAYAQPAAWTPSYR